MGKYDDIIDRPHHVSRVRPRMSMLNRAAQFSPFAALTGYGEAIEETARPTDMRIDLTAAEQEALGRTLARLRKGDAVEITHFVPDRLKAGGRYAVETARVRQVLPSEGVLRLMDGRSIDLDNLLEIERNEEQA